MKEKQRKRKRALEEEGEDGGAPKKKLPNYSSVAERMMVGGTTRTTSNEAFNIKHSWTHTFEQKLHISNDHSNHAVSMLLICTTCMYSFINDFLFLRHRWVMFLVKGLGRQSLVLLSR